MKNEFVKKTLCAIGLTPKEAEIYSLLLYRGELSAQKMSTELNISRPYAYEVCEKLCEKAAVTRITSGRNVLYMPNDPKILLSRAQENINIFEKALPEMRRVLRASYSPPSIRILEGKEGLRESNNKLLLNNRKKYVSIGDFEAAMKHLQHYDEVFLKERIGKKIHVQVIQELSKASKQLAATNKESLRESKFLDVLKNTQTEIMSDGLCTWIFLYSQARPLSIEINNELVSQFFYKLFGTLWERID